MIGMPAGIGSNIKDENYFAQPREAAGANPRPGATGACPGLRECRQVAAQPRARLDLRGAASAAAQIRYSDF
jgi:hypothetical protein